MMITRKLWFGSYLSGSSLTMMVLPPTNGNGMAKWLDGWRTHRLRVCITTRINDREFGITFVSRYSTFRNKLASPWLPCRGWYFHIQLALCMINRLAISLAGEVEWGFNGWRGLNCPSNQKSLIMFSSSWWGGMCTGWALQYSQRIVNRLKDGFNKEKKPQFGLFEKNLNETY